MPKKSTVLYSYQVCSGRTVSTALRRGRRPGPTKTRSRILASARKQFAVRGYAGTTIRGVAKAATVDPALVIHFFGSKQELFIAAMHLPVDPAELVGKLLASGRTDLGERWVRLFFGIWDQPEGKPLLALIRTAVTNDAAAKLLREFVSHEILERVESELDLDRARLRTTLAAAQVIGVALARYALRLEPVVSASIDELTKLLGPSIQHCFDPEA